VSGLIVFMSGLFECRAVTLLLCSSVLSVFLSVALIGRNFFVVALKVFRL